MNRLEQLMIYRAWKVLDTLPDEQKAIAFKEHCGPALLALSDGSFSAAERNDIFERAMKKVEDECKTWPPRR